MTKPAFHGNQHFAGVGDAPAGPQGPSMETIAFDVIHCHERVSSTVQDWAVARIDFNASSWLDLASGMWEQLR